LALDGAASRAHRVRRGGRAEEARWALAAVGVGARSTGAVNGWASLARGDPRLQGRVEGGGAPPARVCAVCPTGAVEGTTRARAGSAEIATLAGAGATVARRAAANGVSGNAAAGIAGRDSRIIAGEAGQARSARGAGSALAVEGAAQKACRSARLLAWVVGINALAARGCGWAGKAIEDRACRAAAVQRTALGALVVLPGRALRRGAGGAWCGWSFGTEVRSTAVAALAIGGTRKAVEVGAGQAAVGGAAAAHATVVVLRGWAYWGGAGQARRGAGSGAVVVRIADATLTAP